MLNRSPTPIPTKYVHTPYRVYVILVVCGYVKVTVLPFVASMPPTANMAPTVALRGLVRGL